MVTTFTYKPSLVRVDALNFELSQFGVIVVIDSPTHTHKHTHKQTGLITIHCAAASVQCNNFASIAKGQVQK